MSEQTTAIDLGIEEILDQAHADAEAKKEEAIFRKKVADAKKILANFTGHTVGQFGWAIFLLTQCLEGIKFVMEFFMANPSAWSLDGRMYEAVYASALKAGEEGVAFLKSESGRLMDEFRVAMRTDNPHRDYRLNHKIVQFVTLCEVTNNITSLVRMLVILDGAVKGLPPAVWGKYSSQIRQEKQKNVTVGAAQPFQKERPAVMTASEPVPVNSKPKSYAQKAKGEDKLKTGGKDGRESRPRNNAGDELSAIPMTHEDRKNLARVAGKPPVNHALAGLAKIAAAGNPEAVH